MRTSKWPRALGIVLLLLGIAANPKTLGWAFFEIGRVSSRSILTAIILFQVLACGPGLYLIFKRAWNEDEVQSITYAVFFTAMTTWLFSLGGLGMLTFDPASIPRPMLLMSILLIAASGLAAVILGRKLWRKDRKTFFSNLVLFFIMSSLTLYAGEAIARFFVPPWPAAGLHGVRPEAGAQAWGRVALLDGSTGFNSWGQRDRERNITPSPGTYRLAFIGDSLLEESTVIPISVRVEDQLRAQGANIEVLNLGVSATNPDEYYYRTKNIAVPLRANHSVLFFYTGNDFLKNTRTFLVSLFGVAAVYPRDSVLSALRLRALNHILTNDLRRVLVDWGKAGELNRKEQSLAAAICQSTDEQMPALLMQIYSADPQRAQRLLEQKSLSTFYEMLRHPDAGLFRSYYLRAALQQELGQTPKPVDEHYSYAWVARTRKICEERGLKFTLVIIPEAFQVDRRMQEQWAPLTDVQQIFSNERLAAERMRRRAEQDGIQVIDLHAVLSNSSGTYLNVDGHWSPKGVEAAARGLTPGLSSAVN